MVEPGEGRWYLGQREKNNYCMSFRIWEIGVLPCLTTRSTTDFNLKTFGKKSITGWQTMQKKLELICTPALYKWTNAAVDPLNQQPKLSTAKTRQ